MKFLHYIKTFNKYYRYTNDWYNLLSESEEVIPTMYAWMEETLDAARAAGEKVCRRSSLFLDHKL